MQIDRRAFLRTGAILPAVALADVLVERVAKPKRNSAGGGDDERSAAEDVGLCDSQRPEALLRDAWPRDAGDLHARGLGFDHQYFRPFVDPLADSARVVYYDQLGHGKSDRPANFHDITLARLSADCDWSGHGVGLRQVSCSSATRTRVHRPRLRAFDTRIDSRAWCCLATAADLASFDPAQSIGRHGGAAGSLSQALLPVPRRTVPIRRFGRTGSVRCLFITTTYTSGRHPGRCRWQDDLFGGSVQPRQRTPRRLRLRAAAHRASGCRRRSLRHRRHLALR